MRPLVLTALLPMLMACISTTLRNLKQQDSERLKSMSADGSVLTAHLREKKVVTYLQDIKINDKNAIATILGNIRQESNFIANICEGGARVPYHDCHRGGYGIIQWTSVNRYNNLGKFAKKYFCDPSEFNCQLRYMVNESVFQRQLPYFQGGGQSISYYMKPAYRWLGWGIKGNRETYAYEYLNKLKMFG